MADPIDTGKKTVTGRTIWRDPETGEDYSERSTTFEIDGKHYTMPTVAKDGTQYTEDQIRDYVKKYGPSDYITGEELPEFRSREDAIEYAISRSDTRKQKEEPMYEEQMKLFNEGGLRDEGGSIDSESGNDVPIGSMKEEVRDDIPAMVSEGEFVLPADVVRYIGLENLMKIRQEAKMGLKQMEAMGQMGNSEEATMPDDLPFGSSDLIIMSGEPQEMNQGGMATGIGGYQQSVFQNQPQTTAPPIPPSSVAPPPPAASPAGGYMPKFMGTQAGGGDNSLVVNNTNTGTANTATTTSTPTTEEKKFVPTAGDVYTTLKYINNETGEIRDFYFYEGNPVTPIPAGFVPYDETADETVDDLESTQVESTSVRNTGGGGRGSINIKTPEPVDWSTYSPDELKAAYEENKKTRMALTALGLINPLLAIFGRTTATMQEKKILEAMDKKGVPLPEVDEDSISYKIGSFFSSLFGKDEKEVRVTDSKPVKSSPTLNTEEQMLQASGATTADYSTPSRPTYFTDAIREREKEARLISSGRARRDATNRLLTSKTDAAKELAELKGMTPIQATAKTLEKRKKKPTFSRDDYDPRGKDQRGSKKKNSSKVATSNRRANEAAKKAQKSVPTTSKESISQKITRGGGFKQGGLASRK